MSEERLNSHKYDDLDRCDLEAYTNKLQQENEKLKEQMINLHKEFKLNNVSTATEYQMICMRYEIHKKEVSKLKERIKYLEEQLKRIDKAIKYIKNGYLVNTKELLSILKGDEE